MRLHLICLCRYYHHDKPQALEVVQNPDRLPEHVVDLRLMHKVEAGEVNGRKCVSLFFTEKLQKSKETVMFVVRALLRLLYCAP